MKKYLLLLTLTAIFFACETSKETKERPRDPWVFRSVMDDQPRIITVTLDEDLYVAYDARYAGLYKAWKGQVNFNGAVYTAVHGPQPTSKGYAYYTKKLTASQWKLIKEGKTEIPKVHFKGYRFKDGAVHFNYELEDAAGNKVKVTETPEIASKGNQTGLERTYTTADVPDGVTVAYETSITNLKKDDDYTTTGEFRQTGSSQGKEGRITNLQGILILNSNGKTAFTIYYHPGFDVEDGTLVEDEAPIDDEVEAMIAKGKELVYNSDCKTCHNEEKKTIGPAYIEVAKRYDFSEPTVEDLASKVMKGGSGVWGEIMMNAHPDLQLEDAKLMVSYVLSLDGDRPVKDEPQPILLDLETIPLNLSTSNEFLEQKGDDEFYSGLVAHAYILDDYNVDFSKVPETGRPYLSGVIPALHFTERGDLGERNTGVFVRFTGYLDIPETSNYVLRLVSDDGSWLNVDGKQVLDNGGFHGAEAKDSELYLTAGKHSIQIDYFQAGGGADMSFQWAKYGDNKFSVVPNTNLFHKKAAFKEVVPYIPREQLVRSIPGDQTSLTEVHPSFDIFQARPDDFQPMVGGIDFLSDGRMVVCTWDSVGPVYVVDGVQSGDPSQMTIKRIATGFAEPLGIKVVEDTVYVLQKQELTKLIDHDGDEIIDEYKTLSNDWDVSSNFHEFSFGLVYKDGYFYGTLATAILPGGASMQPQIPDRGKVFKVARDGSSTEYIAHGLRTPNGIGIGTDDEIFVADNQGDWLPSSKIVHVREGAWFGSRSVDFEGTANLEETLPVVWLPQDEIGNSPSTPLALNTGVYQGQMIHGEVTHGGVKRVFTEKVNGQYQGAVFRFIQGLEAGVNRMVWGPDGDLYIGGIGNPGNWQQTGKLWYGLQRLSFNDKSTFEPLAIRAKSNGIEVEFTEPIAEGQGLLTSDYKILQWYYLPTVNYGGPKMDLQELEVKSLHMSDDRKTIFLELPGMKEKHVVHFRVMNPFSSESGHSLWTTEGWYTMNSIPEGNPGIVNPVVPLADNTLTEKEKAEGWELLFDGKTTSGWRNFKSDQIGSAWKVKNGVLFLDDSNKKDWQIQDGGDIITENEYTDYELSLEWRIEKGGNSGIIFNVVESDEYDYVWQTGPEMQILDNEEHPDGRIEMHRAGDLYDMIKTKFVTVNPGGVWNRAKLISKNGKIEHWLNGYKLVEYEMHTPEWDEMVSGSKFKEMPGFGKATGGHIALQDHGDLVEFKNIKIRKL